MMVVSVGRARLCPDCDILTEAADCPVCGRNQTIDLQEMVRSTHRWPWVRELGPWAPGGGNVEPRVGDPSLVERLQRMASEFAGMTASAEALTRDRDQLRARYATLDQQHNELQQTQERLRQEHEALVEEHEATKRALYETRERHEGLLQDRQYVADQLESALRRIKP